MAKDQSGVIPLLRNSKGQFVKNDPALIIRNKSKEQRLAISKAKKGKKGNPAWNKGLKGWTKGTKAGFQKGNNFGSKTKGNKMTADQRKRISLAHIGINSGDKHPNWKGGITSIHEKIRKSFEYEQWRKSVFERDNYTCQLCGEIGDYLEADHIKPFAYHPELRLDINNGRTLCHNCHKLTDSYGAKGRWLYHE